MPHYRAREPIYLNGEGRLIDTDEVFASDEVPGLAWIALESEPDAEAGATQKSRQVTKA